MGAIVNRSVVRRIFTVATAIMFATVYPALSEPLGGDVSKLAITFNAAAKSNKLSVRLALSQCDRSVKTVCRYKVTSELQALADSDDGKTLDSVAFIFGGGDSLSALSFMQTMLVMMAAYAPDAEASERGVVLKALMRGIDDERTSEALLHGVKFKMMKTDGMGLWLLVSRPTSE